MKKILYYILPLLVLSCTAKEQPGETQLVVEGWIENGEHPVVMVSESIGVTTNAPIDANAMVGHLAKWAKVSISDGEETVILTGMGTADLFPPYMFSSSKITGEVGKTYTLRVEYKDYVATAEATIPEPVPIDTLYIRTVADSLGTIMCGFTDPSDKENYYKIFTRTKDKDTRFHPSALAQTTDENLSGYSEMFVYSTQRLLEPIDMPNIREGDEVEVKLCTMTSELFDFWNRFEIFLTANMVDFRPVTDNTVHANMHGALGYWAGYGVHRQKGIRTIKVEKPEE